jgi:polyphosphate glucokinase
MTSGTTNTTWPADALTLCIDIGGSGFKASVVDSHGVPTTERVRVDTPYPCPPERFVSVVHDLVADQLVGVQRVSMGFPGLVRQGRVIEVPSLSRAEYGGERDESLASAWEGFDLALALADTFHLPTKVVNDADMQGCAVVGGQGLEFVMTLGTGVGTALFHEGVLLPHLELSHAPFRDGMSFDIALGNAQRKKDGHEKWVKNVKRAIKAWEETLFFDHLYVGGGNAKYLSAAEVGRKGSLISNSSGILGGVRLWDIATAG